ncbi:pyridoxamine 5'-phosphate oxidase family protein [Streptomyces flavotricini]|uniref:Pyridoxamine 5'-phosphate oxidase family protein n=1 Tax=Streptomyces flavotricini TaxID=66888 RepID=A0ABS8DXY4_9ACTN|nr:pyridoxamine 5'-phosphate oxidase family protein [Streptomyces flavotricini]MCC0093732.1 pyridoxamine 5'-phosphate oxidase family protein [Streptomyces flavotricini]
MSPKSREAWRPGAFASLAMPSVRIAAWQGAGAVVAYEADGVDPGERPGWSVVATGYATAVTDPDEIERYVRLPEPWGAGGASGAIRIRSEPVTGFRLHEGGP